MKINPINNTNIRIYNTMLEMKLGNKLEQKYFYQIIFTISTKRELLALECPNTQIGKVYEFYIKTYSYFLRLFVFAQWLFR